MKPRERTSGGEKKYDVQSLESRNLESTNLIEREIDRILEW